MKRIFAQDFQAESGKQSSDISRVKPLRRVDPHGIARSNRGRRSNELGAHTRASKTYFTDLICDGEAGMRLTTQPKLDRWQDSPRRLRVEVVNQSRRGTETPCKGCTHNDYSTECTS